MSICLVRVSQMNETVKKLMAYTEDLLNPERKPLDEYTDKELKLESDLVLNYLKLNNETYDDIIDDLEVLVTNITALMYKEEYENILKAHGYAMVVTKVLSGTLVTLQEDILKGMEKKI